MHGARGLSLLLVTALSSPAWSAPAPEKPKESVPDGFWQTRPPSPSRLKLELDLALLLVSIPAWGAMQWAGGEAAPPHCGTADRPCDRANVLGIDRPFIYADGHVEKASDIIFPYAMPIIGALLFLDYGPKQWRGYLTDLLIVVESVALTAMLTHIVRIATRRPRPFLYIDDAYPERRTTPDATMSFWSGHVSYLVSFGVSAAYIFTLRHGVRAPSTWIMWSAMLALGVTSATLQVFAGEHFVTDVLVGAGIGAGVGLLVPILHPRQKKVSLTPSLGANQAMLSLTGRF